LAAEASLDDVKPFKGTKKTGQLVMQGRFEIERDGAVAYLEYSLAGKILELIHTEVPASMRGQHVGTELISSALQWAREHKMKVDVVCPAVAEFIKQHPEYSDLVLQ
jgi:hypothetical protein